MRMWGIAFGIIMSVGAAIVSKTDRMMNYAEAKGMIGSIDRTCQFETTRLEGRGTRQVETTESCNKTDEFEKMREGGVPANKVEGTATLHVVYTSPIDGTAQTGDIKIDGDDDEFYTLKANETIDILVAKDKSGTIKLAS